MRNLNAPKFELTRCRRKATVLFSNVGAAPAAGRQSYVSRFDVFVGYTRQIRFAEKASAGRAVYPAAPAELPAPAPFFDRDAAAVGSFQPLLLPLHNDQHHAMSRHVSRELLRHFPQVAVGPEVAHF